MFIIQVKKGYYIKRGYTSHCIFNHTENIPEAKVFISLKCAFNKVKELINELEINGSIKTLNKTSIIISNIEEIQVKQLKTEYIVENNMIVTEQYLKDNPNHIFVFGDNLKRKGTGGAAALRHMPNTYGFVTKKAPTYLDKDFYTPSEYIQKYLEELYTLRETCMMNPTKTYLVSRVGAGIANKYQIFEKVIQPTMKVLLSDIPNIQFIGW